MNKNLLYSLMALSFVLVSCENTNTSISDSSTNNDTSSSDDISSSEEGDYNFEEISDVSTLFETYQSSENYNFMSNYSYHVISEREYLGSWEVKYIYDGIDLQLTYKNDDGSISTDYYIYDEATDQMIYYLDNGDNTYQYLDQENEAYFNFASYIDYFELAGIDWEEDMVFDLSNHVCKPKNHLATDKIGRIIFGDNANEYWHEVKIYWEDGYISQIDAISINQESTFYFKVSLSEHGYTEGSVIKPSNVVEYVDPHTPFLKGQESYTGIALTQNQIDALSIFSSEFNMNYTSTIVYTPVVNSELRPDANSEFYLKAFNGNYEYSYTDPSYPTLTNYSYLLTASENSYPICFIDPDYDGQYTMLTNGTDDYESYVSQFYLDRVLFYGLDASDFIYDEEKGYITAKDEETEDRLCKQLFYYEEGYGGLRIYLKDNEDGSKQLDKIVTSLCLPSSDSVYSFVKTYTFTDINSTEIIYPDGVGF